VTEETAPRRPLVLTYHGVGEGGKPLFVSEELFRRHLDVLGRIEARTFTVSELASRLWNGDLPERSVAITFDDGEVGAVRRALPMLLERGMTATVFCVAGHLGGASDWPTYPSRAPRLRLAEAGELQEVARLGVEIGGHGYGHEPLASVSPETARREIVESQEMLAQVIEAPVRTFAWPYGVRPNPVAAELIEQNYRAACSTEVKRVEAHGDVYELPRVDAHYLRRPALLQRVAAGRGGLYLRLRAAGRRTRGFVQ
jgi:peptidoglycan/xylan/chitin deacetylase (PgdA/CDA1 family)